MLCKRLATQIASGSTQKQRHINGNAAPAARTRSPRVRTALTAHLYLDTRDTAVPLHISGEGRTRRLVRLIVSRTRSVIRPNCISPSQTVHTKSRQSRGSCAAPSDRSRAPGIQGKRSNAPGSSTFVFSRTVSLFFRCLLIAILDILSPQVMCCCGSQELPTVKTLFVRRQRHVTIHVLPIPPCGYTYNRQSTPIRPSYTTIIRVIRQL